MSRGLLPVEGERWRVVVGDSLELLAELGDCSVDAVVCDPPYGIDFHDQDWDGRAIRQAAHRAAGRRLTPGQAFEQWTRLWATELARVVKPGGHVACFGAARTAHRLACGLEDGGLEIRDTLMWLYGTGLPKSRRHPGGTSTALKPAYEPVILARRAPDATLADTHHRWGTGLLNTEDCATPRPHTRNGPPRSRWPVNVLIDHTPTCTTHACAPGCPAQELEHQHAGAARFMYCPKASRRERDAGCQRLPDRSLDLFPQANRSASGRVVKNAHPTVKPIALMRWLVRLVTPPDGLVLDPFCGSGTTGCAALLEDRRFVGIERDPDHAQVAHARITHHTPHRPDGPGRDRPPERPPRAGHHPKQRRPA